MIEGVEAFELRLEPPQATGRTVSYQMTLRNTGTRPLQFEVHGSDPEGRVKFKVPSIPEVDAGREVTLPLVVGARRSGLIGSPETFDFRVNARPVGTTTGGRTFDARLVHKPMLSRRVPVDPCDRRELEKHKHEILLVARTMLGYEVVMTAVKEG